MLEPDVKVSEDYDKLAILRYIYQCREMKSMVGLFGYKPPALNSHSEDDFVKEYASHGMSPNGDLVAGASLRIYPHVAYVWYSEMQEDGRYKSIKWSFRKE